MALADQCDGSTYRQSSSGCVRWNRERKLRQLLRAMLPAPMLATMAASGSAFAQCPPVLCLAQTVDQYRLLSSFNSLLSSPAGVVLLNANLQTEVNIYLNSTQAQKITSGTILIQQLIPANVLIRAFPTNPNFNYTSAGLPNAPALPSPVNDVVNAIVNNNQVDAMKTSFGNVNGAVRLSCGFGLTDHASVIGCLHGTRPIW